MLAPRTCYDSTSPHARRRFDKRKRRYRIAQAALADPATWDDSEPGTSRVARDKRDRPRIWMDQPGPRCTGSSSRSCGTPTVRGLQADEPVNVCTTCGKVTPDD
jgi:hypothetical protein